MLDRIPTTALNWSGKRGEENFLSVGCGFSSGLREIWELEQTRWRTFLAQVSGWSGAYAWNRLRSSLAHFLDLPPNLALWILLLRWPGMMSPGKGTTRKKRGREWTPRLRGNWLPEAWETRTWKVISKSTRREHSRRTWAFIRCSFDSGVPFPWRVMSRLVLREEVVVGAVHWPLVAEYPSPCLSGEVSSVWLLRGCCQKPHQSLSFE